MTCAAAITAIAAPVLHSLADTLRRDAPQRVREPALGRVERERGQVVVSVLLGSVEAASMPQVALRGACIQYTNGRSLNQ